MDNNEQQYIYLENQTSRTESTRLTSGTMSNHPIHRKDVKNEFSTPNTTQFLCKSSSFIVQHKRDASEKIDFIFFLMQIIHEHNYFRLE